MKRYTKWSISVLLTGVFLASAIGCPQPAVPGTFVDDLGREVYIEKTPQRIISLAPSNTEILFALGLEERIVGVTEFCNYPEAALDIAKVGGFATPNIEKVVALEPDLILATHIHKEELTPALERLGLTVFTLDPRTLDEVLESITLAGEITGKQEEASQLVAGMQNRIKAITERTDNLSEAQRPRVLYVLWHEPLMTVGSDTRIHELIEKAGGTNIARDLTGFPTISLEKVIEANPQVIIANLGHGEGGDASYQFAINEPRLAVVAARINQRVYGIDADLTNRPTPRMIDGLEKLAELIHPELFASD